MSKKRQRAVLDAVGVHGFEIKPFSRDYPTGYQTPWHFHDRDQLVYAKSGVMTVRTRKGTWVVPTHRGVWIPARVPHAIVMSGSVGMRTLYFRPRLAKTLSRDCCVVNVSPLLSELILHACRFSGLKKEIRWQKHLIDVILDQFERIQMVPLQLPHLVDPRAQKVAELLYAAPASHRSLDRICKLAGASKRTIERLFLEDTGMAVGRWRQQLRLMHSLRVLATGGSVTQAALEAGYSTPSAFIAMFKNTLGLTPKMYFRAEAPLVGET